MKPVVLVIAGSDSSAGAGIQADLKSIEANGGRAMTAVTAITAQDRRGVRHVHRVPARSVEAQLEAVFDGFEVAAVKSGMLVGPATVAVVARTLERRRPRHFVCDPVMFATSGAELLDPRGIAVLRRRLLPRATLVTPNVAEAEVLSGLRIHDLADAERAARRILDQGARAVLVTGGHLASAPATDLLVGVGRPTEIAGPFVASSDLHGTGCVLASAIATRLALGDSLGAAVREAKRFVTEAIRRGRGPGGGDGSVDPWFAWSGGAGARRCS